MVKHTINIFSLTCILCALCLQSCHDYFPFADKEVFILNATDKQWLTDTIKYHDFAMLGQQTSGEIITFQNEWGGFDASRSTEGILRLREREEEQYQVIYQEFNSNKGQTFQVGMIADGPPDGTSLKIKVHNTRFSYSLNKNEMTHVAVDRSYAPQVSINQYSSTLENDPILSTIKYHDTLSINEKKYPDVLEFTLKDFKDDWKDSTIVNISYAKHIGLLRYTMNNGSVMTRDPND